MEHRVRAGWGLTSHWPCGLVTRPVLLSLGFFNREWDNAADGCGDQGNCCFYQKDI